MRVEDIQAILAENGVDQNTDRPELIETHISWVIIVRDLVYKIKKPVKYSFLDFSTLEKRKYFCEREVVLNRRLTEGIYIAVVPIKTDGEHWIINGTDGIVADYAVCMRRMDPSRRMDLLLSNNGVCDADILQLTRRLSRFHENADVVRKPHGPDMQELFNDLESQAAYLAAYIPRGRERIAKAMDISNDFLACNKGLMNARRQTGCYRDGHGDLHSRNIFLLDQPQVFDCIEFNDDFRRIDILNDIAFLGMDLDASGHHRLSGLLFDTWAAHTEHIAGKPDNSLYVYYKAYRANIRAKVNSLRARSARSDAERSTALHAAEHYLRLMENYLRM